MIVKCSSNKKFNNTNINNKFKQIIGINNQFYISINNTNIKRFNSLYNYNERYLNLILNYNISLKHYSEGVQSLYAYIHKMEDIVHVYTHNLYPVIQNVFNIKKDNNQNASLVRIDNNIKSLIYMYLRDDRVSNNNNQYKGYEMKYFDRSIISDNILYEVALIGNILHNIHYPYFEGIIFKYPIDYRYLIPQLPYKYSYLFNEHKVSSLNINDKNVIYKYDYMIPDLIPITTLKMYKPKFLISHKNDNMMYIYDKNNNSLIDIGIDKSNITFSDISNSGMDFENLLSLIINNQNLLDAFTDVQNTGNYEIEIYTNGYVLMFTVSHEYINLNVDEFIFTKYSVYNDTIIKALI